MGTTITIADVRRNPEAANAAYLGGATLHVPYSDAFEVWRSLDSVDLTGNLKAELALAGQQLSARGGSATVEARQVEQLAASLTGGARPAPVPAPPDGTPAPVAAPAPGSGGVQGFAWEAAAVVAGAIAVAAVIVAVGFGVGFVVGYVLGGEDDGGSVEVNNGGDGTVTVTRPDNN